MALERLLEQKITNFAELKPVEQKETGLVTRYRNLKETPLYDRQYQHWFSDMSQHTTQRPFKSLNSQLMGVLVELELLGKNKAEDLFENLHIKFWNHQANDWHKSLHNIEPILLFKNTIYSFESLMDIYARLELFGINSVMDKFQTTKDLLFNEQAARWKIDYDKETKESITYHHAKDQLLGILVTNKLLGKKESLIQYSKTKQIFFDHQRGYWLNIDTSNPKPKDIGYDAKDQLLGILVTLELFGKDKARDEFKRVKEKFYDKKTGHWNILLDKYENIEYSDLSSFNELLGILIEKKLEPEENLLIRKPVPEIRRF